MRVNERVIPLLFSALMLGLIAGAVLSSRTLQSQQHIGQLLVPDTQLVVAECAGDPVAVSLAASR